MEEVTVLDSDSDVTAAGQSALGARLLAGAGDGAGSLADPPSPQAVKKARSDSPDAVSGDSQPATPGRFGRVRKPVRMYDPTPVPPVQRATPDKAKVAAARRRTWDDQCATCGLNYGDMLCCEFCSRVAHITCAGLPANADVVGMPVWGCGACCARSGFRNIFWTLPPGVPMPSHPTGPDLYAHEVCCVVCVCEDDNVYVCGFDRACVGDNWGGVFVACVWVWTIGVGYLSCVGVTIGVVVCLSCVCMKENVCVSV